MTQVTSGLMANAAILQGLHTIWLPAPAFSPYGTSTNEAVLTTYNASTVNFLRGYQFPASLTIGVVASIVMPKSWDGTTLSFDLEYTSANALVGTNDYRVSIILQKQNSTPVLIQTIDVSAPLTATVYLRKISPLATITPSLLTASNAAGGDMITILIQRYIGSGTTDTLQTSTAILTGCTLKYDASLATDA